MIPAETPNRFVEDYWKMTSCRNLLIGLFACIAASVIFKRRTLNLNRCTADPPRWILNVSKWTLDVLDLNRLILDLQVDRTSQQRGPRSQQWRPRFIPSQVSSCIRWPVGIRIRVFGRAWLFLVANCSLQLSFYSSSILSFQQRLSKGIIKCTA